MSEVDYDYDLSLADSRDHNGEYSILSSIPSPQAATDIYGWGAAFANGLGGGGNPNSISNRNQRLPRIGEKYSMSPRTLFETVLAYWIETRA